MKSIFSNIKLRFQGIEYSYEMCYSFLLYRRFKLLWLKPINRLDVSYGKKGSG